jgi:hypothetical protein
MPEFYYFKTFEEDSLADAATYSDDWDVDEALTIKRIYLKNKDGSAFTDSTFYLKISEDVFTRSVVPAAILGPDKEVTPELNIPVKSKERISWDFKNQEGKTISLFLTFECEREKSRVA